MANINENYLNLQGSYLFANITIKGHIMENLLLATTYHINFRRNSVYVI